MEAKVRGERERSIVLAHQTAVFSRLEWKELRKGPEPFLKHLRKKKGRRRDQSAELAAMLDRRVAKQAKDK